ncbi:RNA polymerase factor sigma-54 [Tautonia sociabilis]|uniref:RNA polymerase sigma-54 factor n=1 Tax=Tautonia sociabilis TaxID=2080755 RepID=A0A432MDX1_9BACT|nr:RNA polymerase factor sigma-54 [Tautonia sociabilis]RUL83301.1 RNA polymerase sigma-54 factor [Tautonia sociabilis]
MRLDTSQQLRTDMRMRMAPRMIQSMEILQLPWLALQERIDQELIENPLLEDLRESVAPEGQVEEPPAEEEDKPDETEIYDDWDNWDTSGEMHRPSRAALAEESDRKHDAMQNMASRPPSLHDYLTEQLSFPDIPPSVRGLAESIISNLDENGYLTGLDLTDLVRMAGGSVTFEEAERALKLVQGLDPPGVGARDLRECLLLQLTPETPHVDVLRVLISDHLDDIQQNRLPTIEKKSGLTLAEIKEGLEQLRRLNPKPGARYHPETAQYVVPDLIVEPDEHGDYQVRLVDDHSPQLTISRRYQRMLKDRNGDPAARAFIQKKLQSARWLIESIEQRRNTLLKVAKAIIAHQRDFLDKGPEAIQPLKMQQIADQVGVHVTTVSRAVDDKWVQTPRGIFALKRFFGGGTLSADGEEVAWDTIKQKLTEIIAKEDKSKPLSDEEIVEELGRQGLTVARRTVTKYRKALRIPSSRQRKEF